MESPVKKSSKKQNSLGFSGLYKQKILTNSLIIQSFGLEGFWGFVQLLKRHKAISFRELTPDLLMQGRNDPDLQTQFTHNEAAFLAHTYLKVSKRGISLFWEEKILLLIRVNQLYAMLFLFYFDYFPAQAQRLFSPFLMFSLGSWHLLSSDWRYDFIQSWGFLFSIVIIFTVITAVFYGVIFLANMHGHRRERIREFASEVGVNFSKVGFMACEIVYLPLLVNIGWAGMCNFQTTREDIELVDCNVTWGMQSKYQWTTKPMVVIAYLWTVAYNVRLLLYIKKEQKRKRVQYLKSKMISARSRQSSAKSSPRSDALTSPRGTSTKITPQTFNESSATKGIDKMQVNSDSQSNQESFKPSELGRELENVAVRHYTHEEYVQRKELEYALSINETWRFERMFTYSSFHMFYMNE